LVVWNKFRIFTLIKNKTKIMEKNRLSRFISKYNLAGLVESVAWNSEGGKLSTKFVSDDKTVLGVVTLDGFDLTNLLALVDAAPILGYTINKDLSTALISEYGPRFYNLLTNRELKINPNTLVQSSDFENTLDYADALQRWPVVVYEPDLSGRMLKKLTDKYGPDYDQTRYIHTVKPVRNLERIPLLISSAGMVFGGDKQLMIQRAEKVVYCSTEVYNKKNVNSKVKDLAG
jgi:hypothetical protein